MKDSLNKKRDELAFEHSKNYSDDYIAEDDMDKFDKAVIAETSYECGFNSCHSLMEDEVRGLVEAEREHTIDAACAFLSRIDYQGELYSQMLRNYMSPEAMRPQAGGENEKSGA